MLQMIQDFWSNLGYVPLVTFIQTKLPLAYATLIAYSIWCVCKD